MGIVVLVAIVVVALESWVVATAAMAYGLIAQVPGAYAIKLVRRIREAVGG